MPKKKLTIEQAAKEWIAAKAKEKRLKERLAELKPILEAYLTSKPQKTAELQGWRFKLHEMERDSFSLSGALEKLDRADLEEFITHSEWNEIRAVYRGEDKGA